MAQQQQYPTAPLNVFSVMSTWLHADPVDGSQKRPNLRFGVYGNVPRLTVRTNVSGDLNNGKIEFKTDLATFAAAMAYAKDLATGKDVAQERKFVHQDDYVAGKKLDKIIPLTTLVIGREAQSGRIYIALISSQQQRPRIRFFFGPSKYHTILNGDNSPITPKEMSEAYAIGFLEPATQIIYHLMVTEFDQNAKNVANPANFNSNGGSGGQQTQQRQYNNNSNNNRQNSSSSDFPDDIPHF